MLLHQLDRGYCFDRPAALKPDRCLPGKRNGPEACGSASGAPAVGYKASPALACIIGARRAWTVEIDLFGVDSLEVGPGELRGASGRAGAESAAAGSPRAAAQRRARGAAGAYADVGISTNMPTSSLCRCRLGTPRSLGGSRRKGGHNATPLAVTPSAKTADAQQPSVGQLDRRPSGERRCQASVCMVADAHSDAKPGLGWRPLLLASAAQPTREMKLDYAHVSDRQVRAVQQLSGAGRHNPEVGIMVGREPPPHPALSARWCSSIRAELAGQARPRVGLSITQNSGPTGSSNAVSQPGLERRPSPRVHTDLSPAIVLPCLTKNEPRRGSRSVSVSDSASWIRSPARHSTTIRALRRWPWRVCPAWRITATISSTLGGSAG